MKPLRQAKKATVSSTDETQGGDEVFFGSREAAKTRIGMQGVWGHEHE